MRFVGALGKSPKTLFQKNTMLRGEPSHPQKGNFAYPLSLLNSRKKYMIKFRFYYILTTISSRFFLCFSKIKRPQDFILISRSDFFLRILFFTLFRTFGIAPKHSIKPYINIIHYSPYFVNTSRATLL